GFAFGGELARRAAGERNDPDLLRLLVRRHVNGLHAEGDPSAIMRDLRIAEALQLHHGVHVERPLLREHRRSASEQEYGPSHTSIVTRVSGAGCRGTAKLGP